MNAQVESLTCLETNVYMYLEQSDFSWKSKNICRWPHALPSNKVINRREKFCLKLTIFYTVS